MREHPTTLQLNRSYSMSIYLYVKVHNKTGLKYLGVTASTNPHSYSGSGVYWKNHLNKHGFDYSTEILKECKTKDEVKEWGLYYSRLWNIVESKEWANLKEEQGDGGRQSKEVREKIGKAGKGRVPWNKGKQMWSVEERKLIGERSKQRGLQSQETIAKRVMKTTGKTRTDEQKTRMSLAQKGRTISKSHAKKISNATKGRKPWNTGKTLTDIKYKTTAKKWIICNLETKQEFAVFSLRQWCKTQNFNYQVFHRNIKQGKPYKNYTAREVY